MTKTLPTGKSNLYLLKGFTLIELLVVLTIVSVLVSSISYVVLNRKDTLKTITSNIVHNLRMVQQQSIRSDQPYQVEIDLGNNRIDFFDESIELPGEVSVTVRTSEDQLIEIEEKVELGFDTSRYLPENFNPLKGKDDLDWNTIELIEIEEDVNLGEKYLVISMIYCINR